MKKSNAIIVALLAAASAFLLWLWYFLGFNHVDDPLDLVLSVLWWVLMVLAVVAIVRAEKRRRLRVRTVYVGEGRLFNSERGLLPLEGGLDLRDQLARLLDGLEYDFTLNDLPEREEFEPRFFVRSEEFEARTVEGDVVDSGRKVDVTTWKGSVYDLVGQVERPFQTPEELTGILLMVERPRAVRG